MRFMQGIVLPCAHWFKAACSACASTLVNSIDCPQKRFHKVFKCEIFYQNFLCYELDSPITSNQQEQASVAREAGFSDTFLMDSRLSGDSEMPNIADAQPVFYAHRDTWYNPSIRLIFGCPFTMCPPAVHFKYIQAAFRSRFQTILTNLIIVHFRKRLAGRLLIPLKPIDTPRPLNGQLDLVSH